MHRRALPLIVLLPALLAACSSAGGTPSGSNESTVSFEHTAGATEVPAEPERIVTTTDQNALLPLIELGVTPVGSAGLLGDDGSETFRRTEGFTTDGVTFTGPYGEPNLEAVAELQPDLIVGYEFDDAYYDDLSALAPTVLVQVFDRPLSEALLDFGRVVGREDEAQELRERYDGRIADLREQLGDRVDMLSVTVLSAGDPGTFYRADVGQALGTVMDDLGLPRVAAQEADTGDDAVSLEQLSTRDADVVLVVNYSGEQADPGTEALTSSPVYTRLAAVQAGQAHVVDGTTAVGAAWARMDALLDVLQEHLLPARDNVVVEG